MSSEVFYSPYFTLSFRLRDSFFVLPVEGFLFHLDVYSTAAAFKSLVIFIGDLSLPIRLDIRRSTGVREIKKIEFNHIQPFILTDVSKDS